MLMTLKIIILLVGIGIVVYSSVRWVEAMYNKFNKGGVVEESDLDGVHSHSVSTKSEDIIDASKISAGKLSASNFNSNVSISQPDIMTDIQLPEVFNNMIYYNGTYLVITQEDEIEFYKVDDNQDNECEIYLKENILTKFNGEEVERGDVPRSILDEVVKDEI